MAGPKSRKVKEVPKNLEAFNGGLEQIFKTRNIPMGRDAEWLILKRDPRRVASAYMLALDYCREAIAGGKGEVADAAREKGDWVAGQVEVFLGNRDAQRREGWGKLEKAKEEYLEAAGGKGAVPVKKTGKKEEPEFRRMREPGEKKKGEGLEKGTKISKTEPSREELEAGIKKLEKKIAEANRQYDSIRSQKDAALEKMEDEESGWFTSRAEVRNSPEYRKLEEEWGNKEDIAWQRWTRTKERGGEKIRALEDRIEALYWTQEQRKKKIWEYVKETLDPVAVEGYINRMINRLRGLVKGGLSRGIVGCGNQGEREELDRYLLSRLEDGARELIAN